MIKHIFYISFTVLSISSCATFNGNLITPTIQSATHEFDRLNGVYDLQASSIHSRPDKLLHLAETQINEDLYYMLTEKERDVAEEQNYHIKLKTFGKQKIAFAILEDKKEIDYFVLNGRYKKDGFFYPRKQDLECIGFPFLIGGCYDWKTRIGTSKEGDLIVQKAISNRGALLIVFIRGYGFNLLYGFNRISEN